MSQKLTDNIFSSPASRCRVLCYHILGRQNGSTQGLSALSTNKNIIVIPTTNPENISF
jgi:6-phosphofructokinase